MLDIHYVIDLFDIGNSKPRANSKEDVSLENGHSNGIDVTGNSNGIDGHSNGLDLTDIGSRLQHYALNNGDFKMEDKGTYTVKYTILCSLLG